ncbi:MAG: hypothetical protein O3C43_12130 [Verrucomicrobia bacterium]|nr:hypothetical protein [Verrucomicrobiota bacterium]MDA1067240.1 hypothetical protein [Verrucomicrobiota bacterium]
MSIKPKLIVLIIAFGLFGLNGNSQRIQIDPFISIDVDGEDATYQVVPALGENNTFCLWDGDSLQAFFITVQEEYDGNLDSVAKNTIKGMKSEGAKNIKILNEESFKNGDDKEVRSLAIQFTADGITHKQMFYVTEIKNACEIVIVTITDPSFFDSIKERSDKLMRSSSIKDEPEGVSP